MRYAPVREPRTAHQATLGRFGQRFGLWDELDCGTKFEQRRVDNCLQLQAAPVVEERAAGKRCRRDGCLVELEELAEYGLTSKCRAGCRGLAALCRRSTAPTWTEICAAFHRRRMAHRTAHDRMTAPQAMRRRRTTERRRAHRSMSPAVVRRGRSAHAAACAPAAAT
eukprot:5586990-Prymnesium_polylepis.2